MVIIASVLAFGAFWNATKWGWLNSRINVARTAETYLSMKDGSQRLDEKLVDAGQALTDNAERLKGLNLSEVEKNNLEQEKIKLARDKERLTREKEKLDENLNKEKSEFENSERWRTQRGIKPTQLASYIED